MRVMIVDIGSNTVKYDAFDIDGDNFVKDSYLMYLNYDRQEKWPD